ncbi:MAG TPA: polysaccharide deacetylase family protein [Phytomonospora sp.]
MPVNRREWTIVAVVGAIVVLSLSGLVFLVARGGDGGSPSPGSAVPAVSEVSTPSGTSASTLAPASPGPSPSPSLSGPVPPAPPVPDGLAGADLTAMPTAAKVVALTIDVGGDDAGLAAMLAALTAEGVPATFFVTGEFAAAHPAQVGAILAGGHRVGNHSMTHPRFPGLSDTEIAIEVADAERALNTAGADPRPWFRFPYGDRDDRCVGLLNGSGYVPVRWTVDTLGWTGTGGGITAGIVADRVLYALQPGEIVLMHAGANLDDGSTVDADALPDVIARVREAGYSFVTLDVMAG